MGDCNPFEPAVNPGLAADAPAQRLSLGPSMLQSGATPILSNNTKLNGKRIYLKEPRNKEQVPHILMKAKTMLQQPPPYETDPSPEPEARPKTPEEFKRKCLNCESMGDFIKNLQGEIKRL